MNLTNNFTLEELVFSQAAERSNGKLSNIPPRGMLNILIKTAEHMEEVRSALDNNPIIVSSGYRSPAVNAAVGGSINSQHMKGEAVDFTCPKFGSPEDIVRKIISSNIVYDQLILEFRSWVHISFSDRNRKQALIIDRSGTRAYA